MEKVDRDLIVEISPTVPRLKALYDEHVELEQKLNEFESMSEYSPDVSTQKRELKKQKLKGMDDIMDILVKYRKGHVSDLS